MHNTTKRNFIQSLTSEGFSCQSSNLFVYLYLWDGRISYSQSAGRTHLARCGSQVNIKHKGKKGVILPIHGGKGYGFYNSE